MEDGDQTDDLILKQEIEQATSELKEDIAATAPYGRYLASSINLYSRLLSALTPELLINLLEKAYREFYPVAKSLGAKDYSLQQFAAYHYCEAMYNEENRILRLEHADNKANLALLLAYRESEMSFRWSEPNDIKLSRLKKAERRAVSSVLRGENPDALGAILTMTMNIAVEPAEGIRSLRKAILDVINKPGEVALLLGATDYNWNDVVRLEGIGEVLLGDVDNLGRRAGLRRHWVDQVFEENVALLKEIVSQLEIAREEVVRGQQEVFSLDSLRSKYGFEETPTGLLIPIKSSIIVVGSMREAIMRAEQDRETVLSMSPRRFEEFMAFIFKELGFEVELTQCTRDGGADILCMKNLHGLPFRLAIEAKRYRDRPISVALVRSFVGSNKVFQANKLLYITTSRYTMPAMEYADQHVHHLLSLKKYDQIQEWCRHVKSKML